ncbi:hypothetical protein [Peribacillus frigoritolerans]|uniref:hypothetical protein n=1 Tax=Peribacillus frigoritolerans TaxID=450367 RepID=UPI001059BB50|nr:hypothetical protein [Peribacillus frigoritolerans]TDL74242.1 hypothetical protein E2R53_22825 [Peribacillus frigoritolerans]
MTNSLIIKEMYLIHDWLYEKLEVAEQYNDGKDSPVKKFVLVHEEDNAEEIYSATHGVMIFKTYEEALEEKKETEI